MRRTGSATSLRGLGAHDHVCWVYDDHAELVARATEYLLDGLVRGQRVEYTRAGSRDELLADMAGLPARDELIAAGRLVLTPLDGVYGEGLTPPPEEQVEAYAERTAAALAAGFSGYRVAAEATPLVSDDERRADFSRYEHLVDRFMSDHPFGAMCAYRRDALGAVATAELACLHPMASPGATPFHLFTPGGDGATLALDGEVDALGGDLFRRALSLSGRDDPGGTLRIDASMLGFIDHRGLLELEAHAERTGLDGLVLEAADPVTGRLAELLGLRRVRVEDAR